MGKNILSRVDNKQYEIDNEILATNNSYLEKLDEDRVLIESILERKKPSEYPSRKDSLFLFFEFYDAVKFWIKYPQKYIYKVELDVSSIFFQGDMCWIELMYLFRSKHELMQVFANYYWKQQYSQKQIREFMVSKAIIKDILLENEEEKRTAKLQYAKEFSIERLDIYRNNLTKLN